VALRAFATRSRRAVAWVALAWLALFAGAASAAETLAASLREEVIYIDKPGHGGVKLETTLFRPPGDGPFPLVIINHGKAPGDPRYQPRQRYLLQAREFVSRGYAVATPMRQGFADSVGPYFGDSCDIEGNGKAQAVDVLVTLSALSKRPDIDISRTVVMGQSHGGLTTMAVGALKLKEVVGLVNFAGGLRVEKCLGWRVELAHAMRDYGADTRVPSLWFYGDNDEFFSVDTWQEMFTGYTAAGGPARMVAFGKFRDNSHAMFASGAGIQIWLPEVRTFFQQLGLPFDVKYRIVLAEHETPVPAPSGFAAIDDVARIPAISDKGRASWSTYLDEPPPKAFAISPHGSWAWRGGDPAAMRVALEHCSKGFAKEPCQLYAVDDNVVWQPAAAAAAPASAASN
jgi:dienelactone hydrolase